MKASPISLVAMILIAIVGTLTGCYPWMEAYKYEYGIPSDLHFTIHYAELKPSYQYYQREFSPTETDNRFMFVRTDIKNLTVEGIRIMYKAIIAVVQSGHDTLQVRLDCILKEIPGGKYTGGGSQWLNPGETTGDDFLVYIVPDNSKLLYLDYFCKQIYR